jgi:UDP-GlcNAc:undecaprenyl-phosphate GlcNAc-1-phosphate transferase
MILLFASSFAVVILTVPMVRKYALRWKLGDKPNGRKIHASAIPHLGGIGIACGILGAVGLCGFIFKNSLNLPISMLPGIAIILALGLLDDILNLKALQKLAIQIIAVSLLVYSGFRLNLGISVLDGTSIVAAPLAVFFLVGVLNSMNLVDGHDGLAAGLCFISSMAFFVMAVHVGSGTALVISLATGGACLSFLIFNFPPGKIFMGDTGSMLLGISLGLVSCTMTMIKPSLYTLFAVCFILAIPILDTFLAIARRLAMRVPVFDADCLHVHHTLSSFELSKKETLFVLYVTQAAFAVMGVLAARGSMPAVAIGMAGLLLLFFTFFKWMVAPTVLVQESAAVTMEKKPSVKIEKEMPAKLTHKSLPTLDKVAK